MNACTFIKLEESALNRLKKKVNARKKTKREKAEETKSPADSALFPQRQLFFIFFNLSTPTIFLFYKKKGASFLCRWLKTLVKA